MLKVRDDMQRELVLGRPPRRVVSLVPSDTYTVACLAGVERLVGRTIYCEEPRGRIEGVPTVGGTKDASVEAILALEPDLVIANQEENTRPLLEALARQRIPVFVVFPKRVDEGVALVARLARILGVEREPAARELVRACHAALAEATQLRSELTPLRAFCPIWADPLMTIHGETYISDALDLAGALNVFADRTRRYPLAADLGVAKPLSVEKIVGRDVRYPRVTLEEVIARAPEVVLLPDEPHPFTEEEAIAFRALPIPASKPHGAHADRVVRLPGKDLCWYGAWSAQGIGRLRATVQRLM